MLSVRRTCFLEQNHLGDVTVLSVCAVLWLYCTRLREENDKQSLQDAKRQKDDNNSPPLDIELKLSGKHFFDCRQIIQQDEFITIIRFVLALVDSFKVNIKNGPSSNSAKPVHSQNFLLYHNR